MSVGLASNEAQTRRGGAEQERGAAILEFALVAVVLFTIIFGLIEGGLLVRASNTMNSAADDAARRGAIAADSPSADWQILQQLRGRGALTSARINFVVVYRATDSSGVPDPTCLTGTPVTDQCNIYDREEFELPSSAFGCADDGLDGSWCPEDRGQDSSSIEYIGVWIDASHTGLTGVFGDVSLGGQSVLPVEGARQT